MPAKMLDGPKVASLINAETAEEVKALTQAGLRPGLAAVLVGNDPASEVYVRSKTKACDELNIYSEKITPPADVTTEKMLQLVRELNAREDIDGILIQLPLPRPLNTERILMEVLPAKDVDGFHPLNVGFLSTQRPGLVPCTPMGCIELLRRSGIPIEKQDAVVVGRSDIVGKPMAMLLTNANATVTLCHSKTKDLIGMCKRADILVVAMGRAGTITKEHVKIGATVVDVGINRVADPEEFKRLFAGNAKREDSFARHGYTLAGDCHPNVAEVASVMSPVPGGVGPLTIAMLMSNTVKAAKMRRGVHLKTTVGVGY
ncbi:MAG: bifunctional 5,10-methylenetetrahydrofolate dehydrogenase/5,10-methenyltetrahydrofolate cyclohydrolase [Acidobacteriales bacterium]|nr:bifunctional 5,10-methylenetetrahydrofolate dehydrogenase/5,10-methenyltetrahydrofolate cyclohydrolase [Terriglobales bacterium]